MMTAGLSAEEILSQVERILASGSFAQSERMRRFLRFVTERSLAGRADELKEYVIGVEVFDRQSSYDPRAEPIVRVEARRLRAKLNAYYQADGSQDPVIIELPTGSYVPRFRLREAVPALRPPIAGNSTIIAVLPLVNLSPDPDNDYLSDGLTEELIHRLTQVDSLRVVGWQSASQLRDRQQDLSGVREQLNAAYVLRGSIRRAGAQFRVAVQLIDTANGQYLWSEIYDRQLEDVFAIQQEIASAIVRNLQSRLGLPVAPRELVRGPSSSVSSFELYLKGRYHWNKRTVEGLYKSLECFEQAVQLDPGNALAFAGLADSYIILTEYSMTSPAESIPRAKQLVEWAIALDPMLGEGYTSLALLHTLHDWDWAAAERCFQRAMTLNPNYSTLHHWYAVDHLVYLGEFERARQGIARARELDPLSLIIFEGQPSISLFERKYEEALQGFGELLELDPSFYKAYTALGRTYIQLGQYDRAIAMLERGLTMGGELPSVLAALGQAHGLAGHTDEARRRLEALTALAGRRYVPATCFAVIYLGMGDTENALMSLETAFARHDLPLRSIAVHPVYDPLRNEPRFRVLLDGVLSGAGTSLAVNSLR